MCDHSGRLMAWLDRELGNDEMVELERHIGACSECRSRLESYKHSSATFDAYCDAVVSAQTHRRRMPRWVPVLSTAAAAAITATVVLVLLRAQVEPPALPRPVPVQVQAHRSAVVLENVPAPTPAPGKTMHRPRATTPGTLRQTANWQPTERGIQISIPADSMFPPGAVPQGVNFIVDLSIAADGSAEQIRLRPRLMEV
ncbi:MAG: zf-HC2 domain-containing protein, partial [Candidatus Acidiferrum sp.]